MSVTELPDGRFEFKVHGFSFIQNPQSPRLFAFVASSNDLIKFSGVARKSQGFLTNYQRAIDETRVKNEVTPFFRTPENCSPTAVVISLQQTNVSEIEFESTSIDALDSRIELNALTLRFVDLKKTTDEEVLTLAKEFLDQRLGQDKAESDESPEDDEEAAVDAENSESAAEASDDDIPDEVGAIDADPAEEDDESSEDSAVEIGHSMLRQLRDKLDRPEDISAEMMKSLRDMLKPALVIDGQHRLFGAAGVEEDIPLLVCSLVRPTWKEQVFQFIVVNDKAAGIDKPFITSLAGMSLTGDELEELRQRLTDAGLRLWEVEVMQRLGYDPRSPFFQKIEFKVSRTGKIDKREKSNKDVGLGYQTMKRVGKAWYNPNSSGLFKIMELLYDYASEKKLSKKAATARWQKSGDWFEFFSYFWNAFKDKFDGTPIWQIHSNLLTAVVVEMVQADFLIGLNSTRQLIFADINEGDEDRRRAVVVSKYRASIENFVSKHTKALYEKRWDARSLNDHKGRVALADLFGKVRDETNWANHPVITGKFGIKEKPDRKGESRTKR